MSVKPHKSTVDQLIDRFDSFSVEIQERILDQLQLVHRLARRRAAKPESNGNEQLELPAKEATE